MLRDPDNAWSVGEHLLSGILFQLRVLAWQNTEDAAKGRNKPKPVPTPSEMLRMRQRIENTDIDYIRRRLGIED